MSHERHASNHSEMQLFIHAQLQGYGMGEYWQITEN